MVKLKTSKILRKEPRKKIRNQNNKDWNKKIYIIYDKL